MSAGEVFSLSPDVLAARAREFMATTELWDNSMYLVPVYTIVTLACSARPSLIKDRLSKPVLNGTFTVWLFVLLAETPCVQLLFLATMP